MRKELELFFTALMFFTRIPCPKWITHSQENLDNSTRYYPVMGWIVGGFAGFVFYVSNLVFPVSVSIVLSMISSILVTGALHEDGFSDVCDGFGGGWTKDDILRIMKDSRIGAYGAIGLGLLFLLKFVLLSSITPGRIPFVLIAAHSFSRFASSIFRYTHVYVRDAEQSKVKPMAQTITRRNLLISCLLGILPIALLSSWQAFFVIIPVISVEIFFADYFAKRIGGYTGDCLGALQQICEITFYLSYLGLWKFI